LLALIYGGSATDELNSLRYKTYMHVSATSSQLFRPEKLPPTENAAKFHILRVHLQVLQWKSLSTKIADPSQWGWRLHEKKYIPIAMDIDVAPADILKVVCCKCKLDSKRPCGTQACACRKYGLSCVSACKNCNGVACENPDVHATESVTDDADLAEDGDDSIQESDVVDILEEGLVDDESMEYYLPWAIEEEITTST